LHQANLGETRQEQTEIGESVRRIVGSENIITQGERNGLDFLVELASLPTFQIPSPTLAGDAVSPPVSDQHSKSGTDQKY
jgi:hypothetical protein